MYKNTKYIYIYKIKTKRREREMHYTYDKTAVQKKKRPWKEGG